MRLSAMGDVAMTVPVLRAFNEKYPNVKITVISTPFLQPLFNDIPNIHFLPFDKIDILFVNNVSTSKRLVNTSGRRLISIEIFLN